MSDPCDEARKLAEAYLADCLARRESARIQPGEGGTCAVCGEPIPPARLATGAGTCIDCQIEIERWSC